MLVEFCISNFRSFDEEQTLSLVASKDQSHEDSLIEAGKENLLKSVAVYGANASGKSNLIEALNFMREFIRDSATRMNKGDKIPGVSPFRLRPRSHLKADPSSFRVTLFVDGTLYHYGFSATLDRVQEESLFVTKAGGRSQKWLLRKYDKSAAKYSWEFGRVFGKDERLLLETKTRDNGLALSRGAELNVEVLGELYSWFRERLWVLDMSRAPMWLIARTAGRVQKDEKLRDQVSQMLHDADLGIEHVTVDEEPIHMKESLTELPGDAPGNIRAAYSHIREVVKLLDGEKASRLAVRTFHRVPGIEQSIPFEMDEDESNGTQRMFALAGPFLDALRKGCVLVIDELECSMHPSLTRKLIELFQSSAANKSGAQLVFATHEATLMDPELFRRDQIWIVEKNHRGASELYSLYDFKEQVRPRSTEAFHRNYLAGRYGGVPSLGPIFEDIPTR